MPGKKEKIIDPHHAQRTCGPKKGERGKYKKRTEAKGELKLKRCQPGCPQNHAPTKEKPMKIRGKTIKIWPSRKNMLRVNLKMSKRGQRN